MERQLMNGSQDFCFGTLAVGDRYRAHARLLAQDIQQHIPATTLCILTDQPEQFKEFPHVLAFKHNLQRLNMSCSLLPHGFFQLFSIPFISRNQNIADRYFE